MTRFYSRIICISLAFLIFFLFTACGEQEKKPEELVVGNWTLHQKRAYILLIMNTKGNWNSSVRIADASTKIVKSKGDAKGTWLVEEGKLIFSVLDSSLEEVWEKNSTRVFEILELDKMVMRLKEENNRIMEWKKTIPKKPQPGEAEIAPVLPMKPLVVNLNKISSNAPDHYLCLNMKLVLKELMPDQKIPVIHPQTREAALVFLSSLIHSDVRDFDQVKVQQEKLVDVLNPYMEGLIKEVEIDHVILATTMEKVEEFIIEHTLGAGKKPEQGEGENQSNETSSEEKK